MSQLIRFEYQRPGKDVAVYDEHLVLDRPDVKVLLQAGTPTSQSQLSSTGPLGLAVISSSTFGSPLPAMRFG
jgi:hypothetical protein